MMSPQVTGYSKEHQEAGSPAWELFPEILTTPQGLVQLLPGSYLPCQV